MSKYDGLGDFLRTRGFREIPMSFAEIERVTGAKLPPKAQHHPAWWSNNPSNNVMTKIWLAAGYRTAQVDIAGRKLVFRRDPDAAATHKPCATGMADSPRDYQSPSHTSPKSAHPLIGVLRGTFSIQSGYDVTAPALIDEELAHMAANVDRTADLIEAGLGGRKR